MSSIEKGGTEPIDWPSRLQQLAVMIDAGLPIDQALSALLRSQQNPAQKRSGKAVKIELNLRRCIALIGRGSSLAGALQECGVISKFDHAVLSIAEEAGRTADGLNHISEQKLRQAQNVASIKATLLLPQAVLMIGAFAAIFVRMALAEMTAIDAVLPVLYAVILFMLVTRLFIRLLALDTRVWLGVLWPAAWIKQRSTLYQKLVEQQFYRGLIWQLNAGVAADTALHNCELLLSSPQFRGSASGAANLAANGISIPKCLKMHGLVLSDRMRTALSIGNESGRYAQAIENELSIQAQTLKLSMQNFIRWLPRFYYLLVLVVISALLA